MSTPAEGRLPLRDVRVTGNVILSRLRSSGDIEVGELRFQVAH